MQYQPGGSGSFHECFLLSADTELKTIQPSGCNASFIFISISGRCPPCPPRRRHRDGESIGRRLQEIACDCRNARRTEAAAVDIHQFFALGTYLKGNDREVRELQPGFNGNRPGAETDIPEYGGGSVPALVT